MYFHWIQKAGKRKIVPCFLGSSRMTMKYLVDFSQLLVRYVGINLGCADTGMPKHFLHGSNIRAGNQQISSKRMAQSMRCDVKRKVNLAAISSYASFHGTHGKP